MLTLCWAAKGGSGTTVVAATLALVAERPTLLVDLDGDLPQVLGIGRRPGPGVLEWLASTAGPERLERLAVEIDPTRSLLPRGAVDPPPASDRWGELAVALAAGPRDVVVDAGSGTPPAALLAAADRRLLVTRPCYLAVSAAAASSLAPTGIVLIDEPGRSLDADDVARSVGAPVVAELLVDPAVARAVDSGLLLARLPRPFRRRLQAVAA